MTSKEKQRMSDIKKRKKAREQKRKKTMKIVFAAAAIVIIGAIVIGVKSCGGQKNQNPEVQVTSTESPSGTDKPAASKAIDKDFYKNSCFLGGEFIADLMDYNLIDGADYQAQLECTVSEALEEDKENNIKPLVDEVNNNATYKKIFISFGDSELGMNDSTDFKTDYKTVISKVKKYQPDAKIYILGIPPVTESKDSKSSGGVTNKNIEKMNTVLKEIADDTNSTYCDLFKAVEDNGVLPDEASDDGVKLNRDYYEKCLVYIQKNYKTGSTDKPESTASTDSFSDSSDRTAGSESSVNNSDSTSSSNSSNSSSGSSSSSGGSSSGSSTSGGSSSGSSSSSKSSGSSSSGGSSSGSSSSSSKSSGSSSGSSSSSSSSGRKSSTSGSSSSGGSSSSSKSSGSSSSGSSSGSSSSKSSGSSSSGSSSGSKSSSSSSGSSSGGSSGSAATQKDFDSGVTQSSGQAAQKNFDEER